MDEGLIFEELHSEALPAGMRLWGVMHGGYSWVIAFDPGVPEWSDSELAWSDSELAAWAGYTATYVRAWDPSRPKIVEELSRGRGGLRGNLALDPGGALIDQRPIASRIFSGAPAPAPSSPNRW